MSDKKQIIIVGGGAAGFFAAVNLAEKNPDLCISILERSKKLLEKVRVSGGGRCNVCHAEFVPRELAKAYPRGQKALLGPFNRFCSGDTVAWFHDRGIPLKTEADGRMFPESNTSETIVNCLLSQARKGQVVVRTQTNVQKLHLTDQGQWQVEIGSGQALFADAVLLAPGASPKLWQELERIGHRIVKPVPSLFTFKIKDPRLSDLMGLAVDPAEVSIVGTRVKESGPVLITHWGLSGPSVLRCSAWGARDLAGFNYDFEVKVNWLPAYHEGSIRDALKAIQGDSPRKQIRGRGELGLPNRLWSKLCEAAGIGEAQRWADFSKKQLQALALQLCAATFQVKGKSTFKDEFVTCGGISLNEVDFKTMQSKKFPGLFFAGEFLDIDAITGGYNFQAAWTTSWIAAQAMAEI